LSINAVFLSFNLPEANPITHVARPGFNQTNSNLSPSLPPRPPPYVYATFPLQEGASLFPGERTRLILQVMPLPARRLQF